MTADLTRYVACADLGGTKVSIGLVDRAGQVLASDRYLLNAPREPGSVVEELGTRLRGLAAAAGLRWQKAAGAGFSVAGMLDPERGVVFSAPNLGDWHDVPVGAMLQAALHVPVRVEMDANAAALGEAWQGAGGGAGHFIYVVVGTGIGAGILIDGRVFHGWRGTAGEFGHTTIVPDGPLCNCGNYGCLEALAAGPAMALRARAALMQGRVSQLQELADGRGVTAETVIQAARLRDPVACEVVAQTVEYLGIGLGNLLNLLSPQVIALGGGVIRGGSDLLLEPIRQATRRRSGNWIDWESTRIVAATLGEVAPLLGAARVIWQAVE